MRVPSLLFILAVIGCGAEAPGADVTFVRSVPGVEDTQDILRMHSDGTFSLSVLDPSRRPVEIHGTFARTADTLELMPLEPLFFDPLSLSHLEKITPWRAERRPGPPSLPLRLYRFGDCYWHVDLQRATDASDDEDTWWIDVVSERGFCPQR